MPEIDLLKLPKTPRDYDTRAAEKTPEDIAAAKRFDQAFFDGPRSQGYGGYRYDGRWQAVARRMVDHYKLGPDSAILDVGCAKGFLVNDFLEILPNADVRGIDISQYALDNAMPAVASRLSRASCDDLPFDDDSFDLVVSINTIHNLPLKGCKNALREIQRVSRGDAFITVDAWRNEEERQQLKKWVLTAETMMHVDDWRRTFNELGYTGDYHWFIAN